MEKSTVDADADADADAANPSSSAPSHYFSCVMCSEDTEEQCPIINFCGHVFCWPCLFDCVTVGGTRRRLRGECPICQCGIDLSPRTQTVCRIYHIAGPQSNNSFTCNITDGSGKKPRGKVFIDKPKDKRSNPLGNPVYRPITEVDSAHYLFENRTRNLLSNWRSSETQLNNIVQEIEKTAGNLTEEWWHSGGAPVHAFYIEITELVDELRHEIMRCQKAVFDTILEVGQTLFDLYTSLRSHYPQHEQLSSSLPNLIAKFKEEDREATTEEKTFAEIRKCSLSQEVRIQSLVAETISPSLSPLHLSCIVCNTSTLNEHVHSLGGYPLCQRCLYHDTKPNESTNHVDERNSLHEARPFNKVKMTVCSSNVENLIAGEELGPQGQQNLRQENSIKVSSSEALDTEREDISRTLHQIEALMEDFKSVMDKNRCSLHSLSDFIEEKIRMLLTGLEDGWMYLSFPSISKGIPKMDATGRWINDPPKCWFEVPDVDAALT